jgi:hypothetical protein
VPLLHLCGPCALLLLLLLQVRGNDKLVQKVHVVSGDISLPGLGLSSADRATLLHSVNFIIHCAADIRLEADMQVSDSTAASARSIGGRHATAAAAAAAAGMLYAAGAAAAASHPA